VIPNLDAELPLYIKWASFLSESGIGTFLPDAAQFRLRGKNRLEKVAFRIGLQIPQTHVVSSMDGLIKAVEEIGCPVMVKGSFYKAYRAHTTQEAMHSYNTIVAEWGYPVIVQEVITGDELNVIGLGDGQGDSLGLVGVKKVWITSLGKIWTGVTIRNEPMLAAARAFVEKFAWRGPFELECIVRGDDLFLIEINPRFPAWLYFATGVGVNLPARLIKHSLNLPLSPSNGYEAGKLFVRYSFELVTDMEAFQNVVTRGENP